MRIVDIDPTLKEIEEFLPKCKDGSKEQQIYGFLCMLLRTLPVINIEKENKKNGEPV